MKLLTKLINLALSVPIFYKIMGISFGLIVLFCIGALIETRTLLYQSLKTQLEDKGIAIASNLADRVTESIISDNLYKIYELIQETVKNHRDVRYVIVLDNQAHPLAHSFDHELSPELLTANGRLSEFTKSEKNRLVTLETEEGKIYDIAVPVFDGRLGLVRIGLLNTPIEKSLQEAIRHLIISVIIMAFIGVLISYLLTYVLNKPLSQLITAVNNVSQGNLKTRVHPISEDEFGRLTKMFNQMVINLETQQTALTRQEEMRQKLITQIITSQEEERTRIARELHDKVGQTLTSLKLGLKSLSSEFVSSRDNKNRVEDFNILLNSSLEEMHSLAIELRPPLLDDFGFFKAVEKYVREFESTYPGTVNYKVTGVTEITRLPGTLEIGLYRVIQEAFTNVVKHSSASTVDLSFRKENSNLFLYINDNGCGFDMNRNISDTGRKPVGLFGMQERVSILGGEFKILSAPNQGTKIEITVPLPET